MGVRYWCEKHGYIKEPICSKCEEEKFSVKEKIFLTFMILVTVIICIITVIFNWK